MQKRVQSVLVAAVAVIIAATLCPPAAADTTLLDVGDGGLIKRTGVTMKGICVLAFKVQNIFA